MLEPLDNKAEVVAQLNEIMEHELSGVVRYTHYSFMVFGFGRIPIVSWFRSAANETLLHAIQAGELVTHLGEHPSLAIGTLLETHKHDIRDILLESLAFERTGIEKYHRLLALTEGRSVFLEEYARRMIAEEEQHIGDIDKMLRRPGEVSSVVEE